LPVASPFTAEFLLENQGWKLRLCENATGDERVVGDVTATPEAAARAVDATSGTSAPPRTRRGLLPERLAAPRRPRWWQELLFVLVCYELYSLVRNAAPSHERLAFRRAADILSVERHLHLAVEHSLNSFVAGQHALAYVCNYYYATLHFVVTISVMVWLYRRHPLAYRPLRTALLATNVVALLGFWLFALAPPRMLTADGFVDTVVHFHTWGSWGSGNVDAASNQFAAMPSLHIGWALWCAVVLVRVARRTWLRVLGALYPVATTFVIVGTANHYVLDAVGGVVVLALGFVVQRVLSGRSALDIPTVPAQRPGEQPA
jgi:hypothetical protein